ncbi:MAG TPA: Ig-like domain-containing protein [Leptospiraceae bacterium]|nr:Ig-like domain-containing protein [Leptospiraceae bacterium]
MKTIAKKISLSISILFFLLFLGCNPAAGGKKKNDISNLIPLALTGGGSGYSEPNDGGVAPSNYNSTDTQINLPNGTTVTGNCVPAEGQAASLCLISSDNVDRYKSLEIIFASGMDKKSVKTAFSLVSLDSGALPSPGGADLDDADVSDKGGRFTWLSGRRLIFDPYKELKPNETYSLTISTDAKNTAGTPISSQYTTTFKTEHDFQITNLINGITLGGNNDVTFNKSAPLLLISAFTNPQGAFINIAKITLFRLGTQNGYDVCVSSCSGLLTSFNLNTSAVPPVEGGNTYYYQIQTKDNKTYKRFFAFNWGDVSSASGLIANAATGVLDEGIMMKLLGQVVERFVKTDFKVKEGTQNKTFNDFMGLPTTSTKRTSHCINYGSFSFIRTYGDSGSALGDGYCGGSGENPGAFFGAYNGILSWGSDVFFDMDVYISGASIPGLTNGVQTVEAAMNATSTDNLQIALKGRKAFINLEVVAKNRSGLGCVGICAIPSGSRFHFKTTVEMNQSPTPTSLRTAITNNNISVNNGVLSLGIKPFTRGNVNDPNFTMAEWDSNLAVGGMTLVNSDSWVSELLSFITNMIADGLVPQVRPKIVHAMLEDVVEKVAPNVLNAVLGSLQNPGINLNLPNYLPAPLANFPLNVAMKLQNDAQVRVIGANKGLVSSVDLGITYAGLVPVGGYRVQGGQQGIVSFKPPGALDSTYPFSQISVNPGMLLSLHTDSVTQAAYHMWRARAIDLNMDETFIDTINQYAGTSDLFKLTKTLLKASPIISILAPGRSTLIGVKNGPFTRLPPIGDQDPITFALEPIQAPVIKLVPPVGIGIPQVRANLTDLQMAIVGKRTSSAEYPCSAGPITARDTGTSCFYTISTVRVSIDAMASFGFKTFSNPTSNPSLNNINAIYVQIDPNTNFYYSIDVREGNTVNPYGLDPEAIRSVVDPLVKSLVVPLVNNILKEIPLPPKLSFPALVDKNAGASGGTNCQLNVQTTAINLSTIATPSTESYVLNKVQPLGAYATNPGALVECP